MITKFCLLEVCCRTLKAQNIIVDTLMKGYLDLGELPSTSTILNIMNTENKYLIYALQSPKGKLYVGQTKDYDTRKKDHQKKGSGCRYIRDAIQKYGWENMKQFVLIEGLTAEQANYWEEHYIFIFDCQAPNGMNLTSGGDNFEHCQITRDRISATQSAKGGNNVSKRTEVRAKLSALATKQHQDPAQKANHKKGVKAAMNKHERKEHTRLAAQLQHYEKRLEKAGLL